MTSGPTSTVHQFSCGHCGYDLRGTPIGRPCPECGRRSQTDVNAYTPFDHSSRRIVLAYGWRIPLLTLLVLLGAPATYVLIQRSLNQVPGLPFAFGFIGVAFSLLLVPAWKDGVTALHQLHARDPACRLVRWGCLSWLVLFVLYLVYPTMPSALLSLVLIPCSLQFLFAFFVLERLSGWMAESRGIEIFRFLQFGIVLVVFGFMASLVVELLFPSGGSVAWIIFGSLTLFVVLSCLGMLLGLLELSKTALFHILHYHENQGIEQRRAERDQDQDARWGPRQ
ncbi:MAG: hypothetical protein CBC35_05295 [Planctomycetes bacterium TMED75]|nr:hypothetical protein [Planctomycetaceae bacterium]OUU93614.1 MAG: hypothetical protein CBC35_05295 [Planctomycetes bacterium TMED75]